METNPQSPSPDEPITPVPTAVKKRNPKPLAAAILVIVVLAVAGIGPRLSKAKKLSADVSDVEHAVPVVSVVKLSSAMGDSDLTLPSNIQAVDQTTINSRTSGYVAERLVDIGSKVTGGQLLAVIESPELDQQVGQTIAEATKSRAGLGTAEADSAKLQASISEAQADQTRSEAGKMQAEADLAHLKAAEQEAESAVKVARSKETEASKRYAGAKAELTRSRSGRDLAQKTLARWKELEKAAAVSGQDVDEKQAAFDSSQAEVEAAEDAVSSAEAEMQAAQEAVLSAQSQVAAAKADVQSGAGRVRAASAGIASSQANVQATRAAYLAGKSTIASAAASISADQANVRRAQALQSFERITAPFAGVITARNVDVGDLVSPTGGGNGASDQANSVTRSGLFGLAETSVLRAEINVPEDNVSSVRDGQPTEITVQEYPHRVFHGAVFHVSGALDSASRTLLVEVRIPNSDGALKPGMYAQIRFLGAVGERELWLPANALIFNASGTRVAVIDEDSKLHYVTVKLGRDLGDRLEILDGLKGDETVVSNPDDSLPDGAQVKVVEAQK